MATTVHIPKRLLERVDARARTLGISRNRLVVAALEDKLEPEGEWPPELVRMLTSPADPQLAPLVDEMTTLIRRARRNRSGPPRL